MEIGSLALALVQLILPSLDSARPQVVQTVSFVDEGSVPHSSRLYSCARKLQGTAFDEANTKACLNELLASGFFEEAKFSIKNAEAGALELTLHFRSPRLTISSVRFNLPAEEGNDLETWLAADARNLKVGDTYNFEAEAVTFYGIQSFFRSRGQVALFNSIVNLDYQHGNAQISYNFVYGPKGPKESTLPPYERDCPHRIQNLDLTGLGDNVPFSLVDQMMQTRAFSCFDPALLRQDEKRMRESGVVEKPHLSASKTGKGWEVRLTALGRQLMVSSVDVVGFGKSVELSTTQIEQLPLRAGQPFKNSLANLTAETLEKMTRDPEHKIATSWRTSLVNGTSLQVEFDVIVAPQDQLFINGSPY